MPRNIKMAAFIGVFSAMFALLDGTSYGQETGRVPETNSSATREVDASVHADVEAGKEHPAEPAPRRRSKPGASTRGMREVAPENQSSTSHRTGRPTGAAIDRPENTELLTFGTFGMLARKPPPPPGDSLSTNDRVRARPNPPASLSRERAQHVKHIESQKPAPSDESESLFRSRPFQGNGFGGERNAAFANSVSRTNAKAKKRPVTNLGAKTPASPTAKSSN
jgi:hypothetical protein